jgi:hypothetical protein
MLARSLAQAQVDVDLRRLNRDQPLLRRKWSKMAASPFAFLRGASAAWAGMLRAHPHLLEGLPGQGPLVGDLHLENFGTFRGAKGFTFHCNDFDETFVGPWAWDVLRLLTSTLLARPELGVSGVAALELCDAVLDGYATAQGRGRMPRPPAVEALVQVARATSTAKLMNKRVLGERLVRDEKTPPAPGSARRKVAATLLDWATQVHSRNSTVADVTRRIAGTGSLGVTRLLVLAQDPEEETLELVEVKEVRGVAFKRASAELLLATMRALPDPPPRVIASRYDGLPVVVRPLVAGEEKLAIADFPRDALPGLARYLGFLTGELHCRAAARHVRWTTKQRSEAVSRAAQLAGLHEQAFVEFCVRVRERNAKT